MLTLNLFGRGTKTQTSQESFLDRLIALDNEDHSVLQKTAAHLVKDLKIEDVAKFASVVLLKRMDKVKNLEEVFQNGANTFSFPYYLTKAVLEGTDYPVKDYAQVITMLETMTTEGEAYDKKPSLDNTIIGKKLKTLFDNDVPKLVLLMLFPLYRHFLKQTPDTVQAKSFFREILFERFFRAGLLASPDGERFSVPAKLSLIDNLKPEEVFSTLTSRLDKCKLERELEVSEESITTAKNIFEKYQLQARVKQEVKLLRNRIEAVTHILKKLGDPRFSSATTNFNTLLKTMAVELYREVKVSEEQFKAKLNQYSLELGTTLTALINESVEGSTLLHKLLKHKERKTLQSELQCLLREKASLEATVPPEEGLISKFWSPKKEPLNATQLAELHGTSAELLHAMDSIKTPPPTLEWQRGTKRDISPRTTIQEEDKKKKAKKL